MQSIGEFNLQLKRLSELYPSKTAASPHFLLNRLSLEPATAGPIPQQITYPSAEEKRQIRAACFALLAAYGDEPTFLQLHEMRSQIEAEQETMDPRAYRALIDKLTILEDGARYGNKTANLIALQKLFPDNVPKFHMIESEKIAKYLKEDALFCRAWEEFSRLHSGKTISEQSRQLLNQMMERIQNICLSQELKLDRAAKEFIEDAFENSCLLMVRSTGRNEDSDKLMLSGANTSAGSVLPDVESVIDAIGVSISSYFGLSVDQRAMHGCDVSSSYFVPCLLQKMVGELRPGDPIGAAGVMFTQEPLGPTPQIAIITASYGQGEGVVNGMVPCDRILLMASGKSHKSIRQKDFRFGPTADGKQGLVANPPELSKRSCLSSQIIAQLQQIKAKLEDFYPVSMDVEFIVEGGHLFIVQARPVVGLKRCDPSYLVLQDEDDLYHGEVLASASGAVVSDLKKEDAIFTTNVNSALDLYLGMKEKKKDIRAVFVEQGAEKFSDLAHLISFFQSLLIPVIAVPEALKLSTTTQLTLCTQQGVVKVGGVCTIKKGWHSHPASGALSLESPGYSSEGEFSEFLAALSKKFVGQFSSSQVIENLKSEDPQQVSHAVASILYRLQQFLNGPMRNGSQQQRVRIAILATQVFELGKSTYSHAVLGQKMDQLLCAKMVQARYMTVAESRSIKDSEGFDAMAGDHVAYIQAEQALGTLVEDPRVVELHKIGQMMLNPDTRKAWVGFIRELFLQKDKNCCDGLVRLVHWLAKRELLDLYMNSVFAELVTLDSAESRVIQGLQPDELLRKLLKEFAKDAEILDWCQLQTRNLESAALQLANFEKKDQEIFERHFSQLDALVFRPLVKNFQAERFARAGIIGSLAFVQLHCRAMEVCDGALKAVVDSRELTDIDVKRARFVRLLEPLFQMQMQASSLLDDASAASLDKQFTGFFPLKEYLEEIADRWEEVKLDTQDMLVADPRFSVDKVVLGTASGLFRRGDLNMVGIWTLSHQNLIVLFSVLRKQISPLYSQLQKSKIGPLIEMLEQLPIPDSSSEKIITLVNIDLRYPWVRLRYNIPMNNHSAVLDVRYNMKNDQVEIHYRGIGHHIQQRWTRGMTLASVAPQVIEGLHFLKGQEPKIDVTPDIHTFTWGITLPSDARQVAFIGDQLGQILLSIFFCACPHDKDTRLPKYLASKSPIFQFAKECSRAWGRDLGLLELFKLMPSNLLALYFANSGWITLFFHLEEKGDDDFRDILELLDIECLTYLQSRDGVLPYETLLEFLSKCLLYKETHNKAHYLIEKTFSPLKFSTLVRNRDVEVDEFIVNILPAFCLYPSVYATYKNVVMPLFESGALLNSDNLQILGFSLALLEPDELEKVLDRKIGEKDGSIVQYLPSRKIWDEFKKCCIKNHSAIKVLEYLLKGIDNKHKQFFLLDQLAGKPPVYAQELLLEVAELASQCGEAEFLLCLEFLLRHYEHCEKRETRTPLLQKMESYLTKELVTTLSRKTYKFFEAALPILGELSPRWLEVYRSEISSLLDARNQISRNQRCMIADLLQHSTTAVRMPAYDLLAHDPRETLGVTGRNFVLVLMHCKDPLVQQEMVNFLVAGNRWDLLMLGAWSLDDRLHVARKETKEAAKQLFQAQWTAQKICEHWKKEPAWSRAMPCVMLGNPQVSSTALELVFSGEFEECKDLISDFCFNKGIKDEAKIILLEHLAIFDDEKLKWYLENLMSFQIAHMIRWLTIPAAQILWGRFRPFLKELPDKMQDLTKALKAIYLGCPDQEYTNVSRGLGWEA